MTTAEFKKEAFEAIDSRFGELSTRLSSIETNYAVLIEKIRNLEEEMALVREKKHEYGNKINLHSRDIENLQEAVNKLTLSVDKLMHFQYVVIGMGLIVGSGTFVALVDRYLWAG